MIFIGYWVVARGGNPSTSTRYFDPLHLSLSYLTQRRSWPTRRMDVLPCVVRGPRPRVVFPPSVSFCGLGRERRNWGSRPSLSVTVSSAPARPLPRGTAPEADSSGWGRWGVLTFDTSSVRCVVRTRTRLLLVSAQPYSLYFCMTPASVYFDLRASRRANELLLFRIYLSILAKQHYTVFICRNCWIFIHEIYFKIYTSSYLMN